ncbi:MAG: Rhamnolipids biosynthesis 3-oxoacyl-[acyl-carrier-protein] reductase [Candidatus Lokiarchaeum sp. GC14_75]|nr:MAG: Rhamnolipids biosynthesis 3-oxoacyl-[acyl-carrier-protein] reductase [Candidatus Lokiarchaeum sp. GC14_75]
MVIEGKICLITGANSGIGKATAIGLAKEGATIIMICRDKERGEKAKKDIVVLTNNKNVELFLCDLSSQRDIRRFVSEFKEKYQSLHVLINNAGVMISKRIFSNEGFEMNFAVNHLAPFLLTNLLLDILKKSAPARIINVSSGLHKRGKIDFEDLQNENKKTGLFKMYGDSKLALMLWSYELSRRLERTNVTINTVHPGVVNTNLGRHQSKFSQGFGRLFFKKPEKGAETSIYLASSPEVEGITGKYFVKKEPRQSSKESYNEEYAKRIWEISAKMTRLEI